MTSFLSFAPLKAAALSLAVMAGIAGAGFAEDSAAVQNTAGATTELANNTAFGGWLVTCEALTVTRSACRLTQELTLRETGDLVVRMVALPVADGALLFAQVPLGVYLPGGAVYRIEGKDDLEQREMVWQRCLGGVCEAASGLDQAELDNLRGANSILFGYRMDATGEPLILSVDTSRFVEGLEALRAQMPELSQGASAAGDTAAPAAE